MEAAAEIAAAIDQSSTTLESLEGSLSRSMKRISRVENRFSYLGR